MPIFLETIVLAADGRKWMRICKPTKKAESG
jgi:hypothetical protein